MQRVKNDIKTRCVALGRKMIELACAIEQRGINCSNTQLSAAISPYVTVTDSVTNIRNAANEVLTEWEDEERNDDDEQ